MAKQEQESQEVELRENQVLISVVHFEMTKFMGKHSNNAGGVHLGQEGVVQHNTLVLEEAVEVSAGSFSIDIKKKMKRKEQEKKGKKGEKL